MIPNTRTERLRRLRLSNLRRLFRHRYGPVLPDDDAGRSDLHELLLPISVGPHAEIKMPKAIEVWAPWMKPDEAEALIDQIGRMPIWERKPTGTELGKRLRLTNAERQWFKLWTIRPHNMNKEELAAQRRSKDRERKRRQRRQHGCRSRTAYIAQSKSRQKPWEKQGISRRTWYRRQSQNGTSLGTGPSALKLIKAEDVLVPLEKRRVRKQRAMCGVKVSDRARQAEEPDKQSDRR